MRILTRDDTHRWMAERGLLSEDKSFREPEAWHGTTIALVADAPTHLIIATAISEAACGHQESMIWIDEFGIWLSCEHRPLFDSFRKSLGETARLWDKPGHLFTSADKDDITSMLDIVLNFIWGAVIVVPERALVIRISHDEFIDLYEQEPGSAEVLLSILDEMSRRTPSVPPPPTNP